MSQNSQNSQNSIFLMSITCILTLSLSIASFASEQLGSSGVRINTFDSDYETDQEMKMRSRNNKRIEIQTKLLEKLLNFSDPGLARLKLLAAKDSISLSYGASRELFFNRTLTVLHLLENVYGENSQFDRPTIRRKMEGFTAEGLALGLLTANETNEIMNFTSLTGLKQKANFLIMELENINWSVTYFHELVRIKNYITYIVQRQMKRGTWNNVVYSDLNIKHLTNKLMDKYEQVVDQFCSKLIPIYGQNSLVAFEDFDINLGPLDVERYESSCVNGEKEALALNL
jgi:hypothetical protein